MLFRNGRRVAVSPFQAALLSLLFGEGKDRMARSAVCRLLWNTSSGRAVRHRISQLIYQTNRRCEAKLLKLEGELVRVRPGIVSCDLEEFQESVRASRFLRASELLEREFLSAFPAQRTSAFSDWVEQRRITLRAELRNRALTSLAAAERAREWPKAKQAAEALLRLDPGDETFLRRLMKASALGGLVREAEALYQTFAERAGPTGEWTPEPETSELLTSVRNAVVVPESSPGLHPGISHQDLPFLGRSAELVHLTRNIFLGRGDNSRRTVLVSGEAGLGKTRLVEEAIQGARFRHYRVMRARLGEAEQEIPFGALLEGLNEPWTGEFVHRVDEPWKSILLSLMPQFHRGPGPPPAAPSESSRVLARSTCEAFLRLFEAIASDRKTLFFLDDLHWADRQSVGLLRFVLRRWKRGEFSLVAAYRHEELRERDFLANFVQETELDPKAATIGLAPIAPEAAMKLASAASHQLLSEAVLNSFVTLAGGNPLFVIELVADRLSERPEPTADDPADDPDDPAVPSSVRHIIGRRLAKLDPGERKIIAGLAVYGRAARVGELAQLTGLGREECVDAVESLRRVRLVKWTDHGVCVRNDIVSRTVYDGLSQPRRGMLHAAAAEMLRSKSESSNLGKIALHYYEAGERVLAGAYALEAVEESTTKSSDERMRLLRMVHEASVESGSRPPSARIVSAYFESVELEAVRRSGEDALRGQIELQETEVAQLRFMSSVARWWLGECTPEELLAKLKELEEQATKADDELLVARIMDATLEALEATGARRQLAELFSRAGGLATFKDPRARCRIMALLAARAAHGSPDAGVRWGRRAIRLAQQEGLTEENMLAQYRHVRALSAAGRLATPEGQVAVAEARSAALVTQDVYSKALMHFEVFMWHAVAGNSDAASVAMVDCRSAVAPTDSPGLRFREAFAEGRLALLRGDLAEAWDAVRRAGAFPAEVVPKRSLARLAGLEGRLLLEMGRLREAGAVAERNRLTETEYDERDALVDSGAPGDLILFQARYLCRIGDVHRAIAVVERGLAESVTARPVRWLRLALEFVRLSRRRGNPQRELAKEARARAESLGLASLGHDFVPFVE